MKRALTILVAGLLTAVAGFCVLYYRGTSEHRRMLECPAPELAWLKKEFQLGDAEFERIAKLHESYLPRCAELCRRIAEKNSELQQLVGSTNVDKAAVGEKLREAGDLRVQCQQNMFNHFLEVSRQMPADQGRRYLQWVQRRTLTPEHDMAQRHGADHQMMDH
jgi:hypothetical protein